MTDEELELFEDTAEKAATAKGIRHKKGYRGGGVKLPYECLKGAERKEYMGESTISSNLQELTWEQLKVMPRADKIKTLNAMVSTYGNCIQRLEVIMGAPLRTLAAYIKRHNIKSEIDANWKRLTPDQQAAANKRGIDLAAQRRGQQKKSETLQPPVPAESPNPIPEPVHTPHPPSYWAETIIQRDGVAGKDLRAQIAGLMQAVTDDGLYDVKIMVGAREI